MGSPEEERWDAEARELLGVRPLTASAERAAAAAAEIEAAAGPGVVELRKLHLHWSQSVSRCRDEMDRFIQRAISHPEVIYHPQRDEIIQKTRALTDELPQFDGSLEDALDTLAGEGDSDAARAAAMRAAESYQALIDRNDFLRNLDDSFAGKGSVYGSLAQGLRDLKKVLGS